jgi:hypothetical protein
VVGIVSELEVVGTRNRGAIPVAENTLTAMLTVRLSSSRIRTLEPTKLSLGWSLPPRGMGVGETGREKCFLASETSSLCSTPPVPTKRKETGC